jgi:hypothetical protein
MADEYLSLTEIGRLYGVSSHRVGKWLKDLCLRTEDGRPSGDAFRQGYVSQAPSRGPGTYFYVWHVGKTTEILDMMEYPRAKGVNLGPSSPPSNSPTAT